VLPGDRPPPHSPEAEAALIGAILVNPEAFPLIAGTVTHEEFYDSRHQRIFETISRLFEANVGINPVTVANGLREYKQIENAGGLEYISRLTSMSAPLDGCEHYARIVRNSALLRRMITTATEVTSRAYDGGFDPEEFLNWAEEKLLAAGESRISGQARVIGDLLDDAIARIEKRKADQSFATGISSGYKEVDKVLSGFHDSDLVILAARPAMGKTSFALNLAMNAAIKNNKAVLFVSLEMGENQIVDRLLCIQTGVESTRLQQAMYLAAADLKSIYKARESLATVPLYIDDSAKIGMLELRAKARRLKSQKKLDMVMVDYLQLMDPSDKRLPREQQISEISRNLKAMAKELNIPVVALSQLSRAPETRPGSDKRPMLSDLRESGAIEQDADVVMFLYRPEYYRKLQKGSKFEKGNYKKGAADDNPIDDGENEKGLLEVIVAKHRNGPTGTAKLRFIPESMSITDWSDMKPDDYGFGASSTPGARY
jgi:replicative DNA helicase